MEGTSKVELHLHLGGSWPLHYLQSIAPQEDIDRLNSFLDLLETHDESTDYHAGFKAFGLVYQIINSDEKVKNGAAALCRDLASEGVEYVEIRTGLKNLGGGYEGYLKAVLEGIELGTSNTSLTAKVLLSLKRNSTSETAFETVNLVKKYRDVVVGIDISDDSMLGSCDDIAAAINEAHANNIPIALHMGECVEETEQQQVYELGLFNPKRIGHGVFLSQAALEWIKSNNVPVEMCLTSAVRARMIGSMELHPGLDLLRTGHPVCICSDDPLIFRTTLSAECEHACRLLEYSKDQFVELQQKSRSYGFAN
jgi:adenosine deaminase